MKDIRENFSHWIVEDLLAFFKLAENLNDIESFEKFILK